MSAVYSPIVFVGAGVGKTHLLKALYADYCRNHADSSCIFTKSCDVTNHLIECLQRGQLEHFRDRYAVADLLLIDDFQFVKAKTETQRELNQLIRTMSQQRKIVVIASSKEPSDIIADAELFETLESGLTVRIAPPDTKIKLAVARKAANGKRLELSEKALVQIAESCVTCSTIDSAMVQIDGYQSIGNVPLTSENVAKILASRKELPHIVIDCVCKHFSLRPSDLARIKGSKAVKNAKEFAAYLLRKDTLLALTDIAVYLHTDHCEVLRAVRKIEKRIKSGNREMSETINAIKREMFDGVE